MGLLIDLVKWIWIWLSGMQQYEEISGLSSATMNLGLGAVQGSILGPLFYAIFVSPPFLMSQI
jgi:hypothetical protein